MRRQPDNYFLRRNRTERLTAEQRKEIQMKINDAGYMNEAVEGIGWRLAGRIPSDWNIIIINNTVERKAA